MFRVTSAFCIIVIAGLSSTPARAFWPTQSLNGGFAGFTYNVSAQQFSVSNIYASGLAATNQCTGSVCSGYPTIEASASALISSSPLTFVEGGLEAGCNQLPCGQSTNASGLFCAAQTSDSSGNLIYTDMIVDSGTVTGVELLSPSNPSTSPSNPSRVGEATSYILGGKKQGDFCNFRSANWNASSTIVSTGLGVGAAFVGMSAGDVSFTPVQMQSIATVPPGSSSAVSWPSSASSLQSYNAAVHGTLWTPSYTVTRYTNEVDVSEK